MADLEAVYATVYEQAALAALDIFAEHWDNKMSSMMYLAMICRRI